MMTKISKRQIQTLENHTVEVNCCLGVGVAKFNGLQQATRTNSPTDRQKQKKRKKKKRKTDKYIQ